MPLKTLAFDADDTLWHNESIFALTHQRFCEILKDFSDHDHLMERLLAAERRNLALFGYGIKGFTLSLVETAIEVSDGKIPATLIGNLIDLGKDMLAHPVEPLDGVAEVLESLQGRFRIMLITKGDLLDQESKVARSGLGDYFDAIEVVSEKNPETYRKVFRRHGTEAARTAMIGNSVRSDILPMLEIGGWGVHLPYAITWAMEHAEVPEHPKYVKLAAMCDLPEWLDAQRQRGTAECNTGASSAV